MRQRGGIIIYLINKSLKSIKCALKRFDMAKNVPQTAGNKKKVALKMMPSLMGKGMIHQSEKKEGDKKGEMRKGEDQLRASKDSVKPNKSAPLLKNSKMVGARGRKGPKTLSLARRTATSHSLLLLLLLLQLATYG